MSNPASPVFLAKAFPPQSGEVATRDGSNLFILDGREYQATASGLLARVGRGVASWLPHGWSNTEFAPLNITPIHADYYIRFALGRIATYDADLAEYHACYHWSDPQPVEPGAYLDNAYSLAVMVLDPATVPPFPAQSMEQWQMKGHARSWQVLLRDRTSVADAGRLPARTVSAPPAIPTMLLSRAAAGARVAPLLETILDALTAQQGRLMKYLWESRSASFETLRTVPGGWQSAGETSDEGIVAAFKKIKTRMNKEAFPVDITISTAKRRVSLR